MPVHYGLISAHDAKVAGTASAVTAILVKFPNMSKKAATAVVRGIGWQGALLLYGIQTNPQRPTDIPGPINIGFTPSEQRVGEAIKRGIQYLRDVETRQPMVQPYPGMLGQAPVIGLPGVPKPKRKNRFSKAVGKAIKAIKGKVKDPKRAFTLATKQASRVSKGKKKPKGSGAAVKAWVAAKKVYPDYIIRQAMKK